MENNSRYLSRSNVQSVFCFEYISKASKLFSMHISQPSHSLLHPSAYLFFGSLYCKHYGPRSDCSHVSNLIRGCSFASMMNASIKCTWIYATDVKSRQHFQDKSMLAG